MDIWSVMRWNEMVIYSWREKRPNEELIDEYVKDVERFYSMTK